MDSRGDGQNQRPAGDRPVCAIPGVGPGLGASLARRFADAGCAVAMLARNAEHLRELADGLEGARAFACDVADAASVDRAFDAIDAEMGPATTLLYNAGSAVFGTVDNLSPEDFEAAWRVNALGLFHCTRRVLPAMREAGDGRILITGATASRRGGAAFAGFAAAKAAQRSLAESMARQLGPEGIHVALAIIDGVIDTPRTREMLPDRPDEDFLDPDAIAETYLNVARQPPPAWTFELDMRPHAEKW